MPLVFLAHQAPLLPLVRHCRRIDGVALVVGSMAPDVAYVLTGTRFDLWAHVFPGLATFCVPVTLVVVWIVRRVLAPVVPAHLPELGAFHLRDYRALAAQELRWGRAALWALAGALSHAGLDHLGHAWGWPANHFAWYRTPLDVAPFLGRPWTPYRLAQYAGHLLLTPLAAGLLWHYGKARWLAADAARVAEFRTSARSHAWLWGATLLGTLAAVPWAWADPRHGGAVILRMALGVFAGLSAGAVLARRG